MGGQAPGMEEYFGRRRGSSRFGVDRYGSRLISTPASTAEDFDRWVAQGWAVRGGEA